jgi:hypothetical protein
MLGSTLTITLDGSGGTAKVLPLVNQDNYSSEYRLDEGATVYTARVRHSEDTVKAGQNRRQRHTVTFEAYTKPTGSGDPGYTETVTQTILQEYDWSSNSDLIDLSEAMSFYMVKAGGIAAKLLNKES